MSEQPTLGSKEGPNPEDTAAFAREKAHGPELAVAQVWAEAKAEGVIFFALEDDQGRGTRVVFGFADGACVERVVPNHLPLAPWVRGLLNEVQSGRRKSTEEKWKSIPPPADEDTQPVPVDPPRNTFGEGSVVSTPAIPPATTYRQHTSMIKKQNGENQHRHVAGALPPGAAGMCINCNVQPVMHRGAKFCGAKCTQENHLKGMSPTVGLKR